MANVKVRKDRGRSIDVLKDSDEVWPMNHTSDILIVDDIPQNLVVLEAVLGDSNYNLVKASSGQEAIDLVSYRDFAVIILDVLMPDLNGYETAKRIKETEKGRDIPIIFVTAT